MIEGAKRWLKRNRTTLTIGFGIIGVGYVAGQYVISKISEARERMTSDRIAKDNLRRRFQQNQEDCTITVLELLPTVAENIFEVLPSEKIAEEIQQKKVQRTGKSAGTSDVASSELSSVGPSTVADEGKSLSSESYVDASQIGASCTSNVDSRPPKNKAQLWGELKISSITRSFTLLYTVSLLSLLTRIQLNLLGRRNYLSSVVAIASHPLQDPKISLENRDDDNVEQAYGNDFEINRKYLTFSWWLLHRGWKSILENVEAAVSDVFGPRKPNEDISLEKLSVLILEVRKKVEGATTEERQSRKWLSVLFPPQDQEHSVLRAAGMSTPPSADQDTSSQDSVSIPSPPESPSSPSQTPPLLRRLLDETSDLIDSPTFTHVLTLLLDATFSNLVDKRLRSEAYKLPPLEEEPPPATKIIEIPDIDPTTATTKLATILAVVTREAHRIGGGVPNEYLQAMESVGDLEGFAAVIYSSNCELEAGFDSSVSMSSDETKPKSSDLESMPTAEVEESVGIGEGGKGLRGMVTGAVDGAWTRFEGVWGKVTGGG